MKLSNPLEMNDWRITSFLLFSFSMLVLLWTTFILNSYEGRIPLIQQIAGCICLLFIPGIAILRILRLHKLGSVETPLFAIGISISIVISTGLLLNEIAPAVGINDPLSALNLILAMSGVTLSLCIISYWRDKDFASPTQLHQSLLSPEVLSLLLLPFLSIFGAYLVTYYEINWLILLMLICVAVVVLVIASHKNVNRSIYPLAIFVISLSLLLSNTLVSRYLWGWDIFTEAHVVNSVVSLAAWNPSYAATSITQTEAARYNSVLSLSILAPALSQIGNIDVASLFKIVYPIIFSLVPVALYQLFRKQTSDIIAFLSSFFFMLLITFFTTMPSIARQEIAEFFLVLVLLLIFNKTFRTPTKTFLLILFSGMLIVSHYGTAWLFMLMLIAVFILLFLADSNFLRRLRQSPAGIPSLETTAGTRTSTPNTYKNTTLTATSVFLFMAMTFAWFTYTEGSLLLGDFFTKGIMLVESDLFSSVGAQTALKVQSAQTLLEVIASRLNTVASFLIFLGVIATFIQRKRMAFDKEYLAFVVISCGLAVLVFGAQALDEIWASARLQVVYLMILSPFLVIGMLTLFRIPRLIRKNVGKYHDIESKAYPATAVFLVILLLFNTGFVLALSDQGTLLIPSLFHKDLPMFVHEQDLAGARWLTSSANPNAVYADPFSKDLLLAYSKLSVENIRTLYTRSLEPKSMLFISSDQATSESWTNPQEANFLGWGEMRSQEYTGTLSRVYDSGCVIYATPV